jgi:hypothetical protein
MTASGVIPAAVAAGGGGDDDDIIPKEGYGTEVTYDETRRLHVQTDSGMTGVRMVWKGCFRPIYTAHMYHRCRY